MGVIADDDMQAPHYGLNAGFSASDETVEDRVVPWNKPRTTPALVSH